MLRFVTMALLVIETNFHKLVAVFAELGGSNRVVVHAAGAGTPIAGAGAGDVGSDDSPSACCLSDRGQEREAKDGECVDS